VRRLLFDLNVVLDVLLDRPPHAAAAAAIWAAAERKQVDGLITAHGVTTNFCIAARQRDAAYARRVVGDLLTVFRVALVDHAVIRRALTLGWRDFEDAVCAAAAEATGVAKASRPSTGRQRVAPRCRLTGGTAGSQRDSAA